MPEPFINGEIQKVRVAPVSLSSNSRDERGGPEGGMIGRTALWLRLKPQGQFQLLPKFQAMGLPEYPSPDKG